MSIFTLIAIAMGIHSCYIGSKVVVSLYALHMGASQFTVGLLAACYALVPLCLGVYTGRLADSRGKRFPILFGAIITIAAMLTGFVWRSLPGLFVTATLVGTGFVFFNVAVQTLGGAVGKPEHRARNFAWLAIGYSSSNLIGPVFSGFSIDYFGHALTFLFLALFPLIPIVIVLRSQELPRPGKSAAAAGKRTFDLLKDAELRKLIIISGLSVASGELFAFYVPVFSHEIGHSASTIGLILGAYALAIVLTRFMLGTITKRFTMEQIMVSFLLFAAVAFAVFPLLRSAPALMTIAFFIGIGVGVTQPLLMAISYERAPPGRTGEMTGLRLTANNLARISMPVISGVLGAALGAAPVFWLNALNLALMSFLSREKRASKTAPP